MQLLCTFARVSWTFAPSLMHSLLTCQVAKELEREREHSSYLVDELKGALSSPRVVPMAVPAHVVPRAIQPSLARRMSSVAGEHCC